MQILVELLTEADGACFIEGKRYRLKTYYQDFVDILHLQE